MSLICRHVELWHSGEGRRSVDKTGNRKKNAMKQDGNEKKAMKRKLYTEKISGPKILD